MYVCLLLRSYFQQTQIFWADYVKLTIKDFNRFLHAGGQTENDENSSRFSQFFKGVQKESKAKPFTEIASRAV
jgi:hypothetical protein